MNVYTYLKVKPPVSNKPINLPSYSFIHRPPSFDRQYSAFYQDPGTQNLQEFLFHGVFPYSSRDEEIYETVGKPIIKQLAEGTPCVLLLYGDKDSGKTTTLLGSEGKGIIYRLLLDLINYGKESGKMEGQSIDKVGANPMCGENPELSLSEITVASSEKDSYYEPRGTTVEVSHLLTNNKFEIYDLLLPTPNLQLYKEKSSLRREHFEAMKVGEKSKSRLYHKMFLNSEQNLIDLLLTSHSNTCLYESSKAKEDRVYDSMMTVVLEFKRRFNEESVFSHLHLIEISEYEPLLEWFQKESFFQNSSLLLGQLPELSIIQKVLWKSIQEKQSLHLIGCVLHESSHFPQNLAVCRFANILYDHLASPTTATTSYEAVNVDVITQQTYQNLLTYLQRLQEDTEEMKERIIRLDMDTKGRNESNQFDSDLSLSFLDSPQSSAAVQRHVKAQKNILLLKMTIKDYEILLLRKELELQACRHHLEGTFHRLISDSVFDKKPMIVSDASETRLVSSIPSESTPNVINLDTSSGSLISDRSLESENAILTNSLELVENETSLPSQRHESSFTLDEMDTTVHKIVPHSDLKCRVCQFPRPSKCITCSNYFQVGIGICEKCFPEHFVKITSPKSIVWTMQYVNMMRKKAGLPPFEIRRDPDNMPFADVEKQPNSQDAEETEEEEEEEREPEPSSPEKNSRKRKSLSKLEETIASPSKQKKRRRGKPKSAKKMEAVFSADSDIDKENLSLKEAFDTSSSSQRTGKKKKT